MSVSTSRRSFIRAAGAAGVAGVLGRLPRVSMGEATLGPGLVRRSTQIEPLVRLLEETSRERIIEEVAALVRRGTSYRDVLAALLLAGVRNVQPRPSVGFKFHSVLVVNSCHLASLSGPDEDRWLPIFWALDYFKATQADEARSSGWRMAAVDESRVPDSLRARDLFVDAMERWDAEQADVATAGLVRTTGATEVFNLFARYAARDYRSIGHKAIYLANAWRTLQVIGWEFAEPVLRSLSFALLNHTGEPNPAESDLEADRPWRTNAELAEQLPSNWRDGRLDDAAPRTLFAEFRTGSPESAARTAAQLLAGGVAPQSVWDAVFVGAGELLMRQPGIIGLHGLTTANAVAYLWRNAADDGLRRRLLLQACAFNPMFRESARDRGNVADTTLEALEPLQPAGTGNAAVEEIFAQVSSQRMQAARMVRAFLAAGGSAETVVDQARRLIFVKGRDAHDYKFSSAVLEDYAHVSPAWRDQFLALSVFNLKGSGDRDSGLVDRTRAALQS